LEPLVKIRTEKVIRDLLAKLLKNRRIDPEVMSSEILPQFSTLLHLTTDYPSHSDFWLEDLQKQAQVLFTTYNEVISE